MKTLSEYNREYSEKLRHEKEGWIGIACDECNHELRGSSYLLLTNPPQQDLECDNCGWKGRRYV